MPEIENRLHQEKKKKKFSIDNNPKGMIKIKYHRIYDRKDESLKVVERVPYYFTEEKDAHIETQILVCVIRSYLTVF